MSYQPTPTPATPTGVQNIVPRSERRAAVDDVRGSFEATFGGYVPPEWTLDAECTRPGVDPAIFYPGRGRHDHIKQALRLCAGCSVRQECLDDALAFEVGDIGSEDVRPEVHGIRGGKKEVDRVLLVAALRRERAEKTRAAAVEAYKAGEFVEDIARRLDVSVSSITKWAKAAGVQLRPQGTAVRNAAQPPSKRRRSSKGDAA